MLESTGDSNIGNYAYFYVLVEMDYKRMISYDLFYNPKVFDQMFISHVYCFSRMLILLPMYEQQKLCCTFCIQNFSCTS